MGITIHWGSEALNKGNSSRIILNDAHKEFVGTDLHSWSAIGVAWDKKYKQKKLQQNKKEY